MCGAADLPVSGYALHIGGVSGGDEESWWGKLVISIDVVLLLSLVP